MADIPGHSPSEAVQSPAPKAEALPSASGAAAAVLDTAVREPQYGARAEGVLRDAGVADASGVRSALEAVCGSADDRRDYLRAAAENRDAVLSALSSLTDLSDAEEIAQTLRASLAPKVEAMREASREKVAKVQTETAKVHELKRGQTLFFALGTAKGRPGTGSAPMGGAETGIVGPFYVCMGDVRQAAINQGLDYGFSCVGPDLGRGREDPGSRSGSREAFALGDYAGRCETLTRSATGEEPAHRQLAALRPEASGTHRRDRCYSDSSFNRW